MKPSIIQEELHMNPYLSRLAEHITASPPSGDVQTMLDLIYQFYTEYHPIEGGRICSLFDNLESHFLHLSPREREILFDLVCELCCEHERLAFLEGLGVGARLVMELEV